MEAHTEKLGERLSATPPTSGSSTEFAEALDILEEVRPKPSRLLYKEVITAPLHYSIIDKDDEKDCGGENDDGLLFEDSFANFNPDRVSDAECAPVVFPCRTGAIPSCCSASTVYF